MSVFLDTTGNDVLTIAICMRCNAKRPWSELIPDGNSPGLRVCRPTVHSGCWDTYDPYRLPPRQPDKISMQWTNPDVPLISDPVPTSTDPTPPEPPPNPVPTPPQ